MREVERIARLERMVFLMLTIINGELGKTYWNPQLQELYGELRRPPWGRDEGVLQGGSMPERTG